MSYIKELYKHFNLNLFPNDEEENYNHNNFIPEKKDENNFIEEEDIFNDINDEFINHKDCKTNRYNPITSFNFPKDLPEETDNYEIKKCNKISLDIIKDIPKYSRIKTNREECYYKRKNEEDYNEIIKDFLYISSYKTASTIIDLQNLKITNIINCSGDLCKNLFQESSLLNIEYLTLNIRDNVSENIECLFFKCINYINNAKEKNGRVLIHCYKGVSRSVSIAIAYLIYFYKWTYDKAFDFIQSKRSIANPNISFYLQLKTFQKRLTLEDDHLEIFAVSSFSQEQKDFIVCRLIYNNICLKNNSKNSNNKEDNSEESEDSDDNDKDKDNIDNNDENENKNNEEIEEKKEVILNEKGMFIFAMKYNIFIVEGKKISDKNIDTYKKMAIDYIKDIQKYEKLGLGINEEKINIIKQEELELKYNELINVHNIIITFSETNNMDKYYIE